MTSKSRLIFLLFLLVSSSALAAEIATTPESLKLRPGLGGPPVPIETAIYIIDLREIDGARQTFTADIAVRLRWKDHRLSGAEGLRILPLTAAWSPGIQIVNRVTVQTTLPDMIEVDQDGNVTYRQRYIGQFSCFMDLDEFPFDTQILPVRFATPGLLPSDVQFTQDPESNIANRLSITDWKVMSWKVKPDSYQLGLNARSLAGFSLEISASRHFHFFLVQIIIPMTLILGMSWIVFWIDLNQAGPRISISITSMLTIVAYRLLLGNFLPRLPFLTRMDYFVFGCTFLIFLSLVNVVFINRLVAAKRESLAIKLDKHSRWIFPFLFVSVVGGAFFL